MEFILLLKIKKIVRNLLLKCPMLAITHKRQFFINFELRNNLQNLKKLSVNLLGTVNL